ncbi:MAG TPA: globin domain-containing protein [Gemmatimonadaceae bacterium]|nr:globin domain-containing protein [Gemmatimonadaceae bacterium]
MTSQETDLVRASWPAIAARSAAIAGRFYDLLFELEPAARARFQDTNLEAQQIKFMQMLALIVRQIEDPEALVATLVDSGRRHGARGTSRREYGVAGEALLRAISDVLGSAFTMEQREAWRAMYALTAGVMQRAGDYPKQ